MTQIRFFSTDPKSVLRDPVTRQIVGADGILVDENDRYWLRRERDGSATRKRPRASQRPSAQEQDDDAADDVERI